MAKIARSPLRFVSARVRNGDCGGRDPLEFDAGGEIKARACAWARARQREVIGCGSV